MIKAICIDLDGVYFKPIGIRRFVDSIVEKGVKKENVEHVVFRSVEMRSFKSGEINEDKFWQFAREYLKIKITNQEFRSLLSSSYEIDEEVEDFTKRIRKNGYKTCICSNNFPTRIEALEEKFHFLQNFDIKIFSYQVGILKPDKRIFEKLIEQAQVEASEIVYSDDSFEKLTGAKELGINAFVYENFENFRVKLKDLGVTID